MKVEFGSFHPSNTALSRYLDFGITLPPSSTYVYRSSDTAAKAKNNTQSAVHRTLKWIL
jgi:hypothetical protein